MLALVYWASVFILPKTVVKEINKLLKGFLWCQGELTKGKAKISWDKISKPKDQGGLGIKDLQVWNEVLIMKHLWNIAAKKDTLWVKWISVEKLKGRSIWEVTQDSSSSIGWSNILKLRDKVRRHVFYKIGNGKSTSAWFDKWCEEGPLCEIVSAREIYNARLTNDCTMDKIINNDNWSWPEEWFGKFPILDNIQVPALHNVVPDKAMWETGSGHKTEFATKTVWKDMCENGNKVVWKEVVWFSQSIPRHSFVLWMAIQNRLMTQDRLAKWNQSDELKCVFCKLEQDSHEHLFFICAYANRIWNEMQKFIDMKFSCTWKEVIEEFSKLKANKNIWSVIRRLVLGATVYFIWQERNSRFFKSSERKIDVLVLNIIDSIKWRIMSFIVTENVKAVEDKWNVKLRRIKRNAE